MINTGSQCCHQRTTNKHLASWTRAWQEAPVWRESVRVPAGEQQQEDKVPPQQNRKKWTGELHRQLGGAAKVARGKKVRMLMRQAQELAAQGHWQNSRFERARNCAATHGCLKLQKTTEMQRNSPFRSISDRCDQQQASKQVIGRTFVIPPGTCPMEQQVWSDGG